MSENFLADDLLGGGDDLVDPGDEIRLEGRAGRHRHRRKVQPLGRLFQQAKTVIGENRGDLGGDAGSREAFIGDHQPSGLADRIENGL